MRIGELGRRVGVTTKTIRFYESIGLLPHAPRTTSGYRDYVEEDAERLTFIKAAQRLGLTLDEIREIIAFRDRGEPPCAYVAQVLQGQVAELDDRIREMRQLREELKTLAAKAAVTRDDGSTYCSVIQHVELQPRSSGGTRRSAGKVAVVDAEEIA